MAEGGDWSPAPGNGGEARGIAQLGFGILVIVALLASWKAMRSDTVPPDLVSDDEIETPQSTDERSLSPRREDGAARSSGPPRGAPSLQADDGRDITEAIDRAENCQEGLILPPGWKALQRCFPNRAPADAVVQRLRNSNLHATSARTYSGAYVVRYQPLSEAKARAAGAAALAARRPAGDDLYKLNILHDDDLNSFTWQVSMPCPKGWKDAGAFKLTAYVLAQEQDFPDKPRIQDPCGLKGNYSRPFLFGEGVRMQGSGITSAGELIHFKGKNCFEVLDCPRTAVGRCARAGRTIAVDPKVITLGSEVLVEDIGYRIAEDTGGGIRGEHIDIYYGTELRLRQAWAHTREDRQVCVKPRQMAM